jgi:flavodoxin
MKACVIYFSRTGNTKSMAEAISDSIKASAFDITSCEPSVVEDFDMLILGTPVEGLRPAKEILNFIEQMPEAEGKKTIVFCTYALWKARTLRTLANKLAKKGYDTVLSVSKKGVKPNKTDFSDILDQIEKAIEK